MEVIDTALPEVKILHPSKHGDERGFFSETFSSKAMAAAGLVGEFVQDNQSLSVQAGVVRGLHYQLQPMAQDKLVRVIRGAILDVAVDVRRGSPNFGKHVAVELSADNWRQLLVPRGFAHGFATLVANTEVFYKVTNFYSPQHDRGIRWNDPILGIDWKIDPMTAILSGKDRKTPFLSEAVDLFE